MDQRRASCLIVLDASITIAWLLNETGFSARELSEAILGEAVIVPAHWSMEVGNVLLTNLRRKRIAAHDVDAALSDLATLDIEIEPPIRSAQMSDLLRFAQDYGLTYYDAAYLSLARDRGATLATLDRQMQHAAVNAGVIIFPTTSSNN
ncbi:VapC toxin family PIN domain ribonuclease [Rhodopseudomonas palustris]|uniref:Ribonuclease VapC n=1 Tax=Rhodopseudomonas palustris TaxID=1076 RepID=A0A323ULV7_RHOPL|nr:VapC toxin family PIN domain ribonuclease [Rhodopseudomonas palustris]